MVLLLGISRISVLVPIIGLQSERRLWPCPKHSPCTQPSFAVFGRMANCSQEQLPSPVTSYSMIFSASTFFDSNLKLAFLPSSLFPSCQNLENTTTILHIQTQLHFFINTKTPVSHTLLHLALLARILFSPWNTLGVAIAIARPKELGNSEEEQQGLQSPGKHSS